MTISDINSEIRDLCDADSTSLTNATLLRRVNSALEELVADVINADGTWQYDDTNYTDHPRGTGTLVEGQEDYAFTSEYLQIEAVDVKNLDGKFQRLLPVDHHDLDGIAPDEHWGTDSSGNPLKGMPEYFDQNGDTIRLYPAPTSTAVTLASGLRVWFKRTADIFTSAQVTTGTKTPGLPSTHHVLLAYMAAIPYCMSYKKDRVAWLEKKVMDMKKTLIEHYSHREKARPARLNTRIGEFR